MIKTTFLPLGVEVVDGGSRFRADLVLQRPSADHRVVGDDIQDGSAPYAPLVDVANETLGLGEAEMVEQRRPAHRDLLPINERGDAATGESLEADGRGDVTPDERGGDDGASDRVLAICLRGSGQCQDLIWVSAVDRGMIYNGVVALGQRAGLVEQDRVDSAHLFERPSVLDQDAGAGRCRGRNGDHERYCQSQCVRAGDHQDRHGTDDASGAVADSQPNDERDHRGRGRQVEERGGGSVGESLGARLRQLSVGHHALDTCQCRVLAHRFDSHSNRRIRRHGSGHDPIALTTAHGPGFSCDHRLIERGVAGCDQAVGRHAARSAVSGSSSANATRAPRACPIAFISCQ